MAAFAVAVSVAVPALAQNRYFSTRDLQGAVDALAATDLDGHEWTARRLEGRVVLLDFWATWCAPCLDELPNLKALRERHGPERFEVLGVSLDVTSRRNFVSWINRQGVDWPQVHDGRGFNGPVARAFGVRALPASLLVGPDGRILAQNLRGERLAAAVADAVQRASTSSFDAARVPMVMRWSLGPRSRTLSDTSSRASTSRD